MDILEVEGLKSSLHAWHLWNILSSKEVFILVIMQCILVVCSENIRIHKNKPTFPESTEKMNLLTTYMTNIGKVRRWPYKTIN